MGGGIGVRLMTPLWLRYWRVREYDADHYAATLGQGPLLAEFLELYTQPFDLAIPYFDGMTHPIHGAANRQAGATRADGLALWLTRPDDVPCWSVVKSAHYEVT
jgi:hypothetical protein